MRERPLLKHIAVALLMLVSSGCEYLGLTCWDRLKMLNADHWVLLETNGEIDALELAQIRTDMAHNVETCRDGDFYKNLRNADIGPESYFTLLDFAIMADNVGLTAAMFERQMNELSPEFRREKLALGGLHLQNAAYVESAGVVRWLLEAGFDVNATDEIGANVLHFVGTRTDYGLAATSDLVAAGADIERETQHGMTPLNWAWRQGNLRKVQCLVSLGAQIPDPLPVMEEPQSLFVDPYDVEAVTAFLTDTDREIPDRIARICSIDL